MTAGHHGSQTETAHAPTSAWASYLTHLATGVLLGLIVALAMLLLHGVTPFPALDAAGADAAQRMYAHGARATPGAARAVIIGLDKADLTQIESDKGPAVMAAALGPILAAQPASVIIDLEFASRATDEAAQRMAEALRTLLDEYPRVPVVLAAGWRAAAEGHVAPAAGLDRLMLGGDPDRRLPNLSVAMSLLEPDADGVVRRVQATLCRAADAGGWEAVPHLAAPLPRPALPAATPPGTPERGHAPLHPADTPPAGKPGPLPRPAEGAPCRTSPEVPILFRAAPERLVQGALARGPVRFAKLGTPIPEESLRDAIVIIGAVGAASGEDRVQTPLGIMEGPLLLANAALTLADPVYIEGATGHGPPLARALLWLLCSVLVFIILAPLADFRRGGVHGTARIAAVALASIAAPAALGRLVEALTGHEPHWLALLLEVAAVIIASAVFSLYFVVTERAPPLRLPRPVWGLAVFLVCAGAAAFAVLLFNLVIAERYLQWGWRLGSLLPAFAVVLEAVAEAMKPTGTMIHHAVAGRIFGRSRRPALLASLALLVAAAAAATGPAGAAGGAAATAPGRCPEDGEGWPISIRVRDAAALRDDSVRRAHRGPVPQVLPLGECRRVLPGEALLVAAGVELIFPEGGVGEAGPLIFAVPPLPMPATPGLLARFGLAAADAVLPPVRPPRLQLQAARAVALGTKKAQPGN
jgi:hypothetical protein